MFLLRKQKSLLKSVSWAISLAILVVTLIPVHFHLHHKNDPQLNGHSHVADLHLKNEEKIESLCEDDAIVYTKAAPDKQPYRGFLPLVILSSLSLPLPEYTGNLLHLAVPLHNQLKTSYQYFSPPLRAPPASSIV